MADSTEVKPEPKFVEESPVVTKHRATIGGRTFDYTATVGRMPFKNDKGEIIAQMFYVAYSKDNIESPASRPLMFSFNGGPGSPAIWLHMGALGPKRVPLTPEFTPKPPHKLTANEFSWLDKTDLVFIDPIGTGYSEAKDDETGEKYWGIDGDIESVSEFIRRYLGQSERWTSPLFLVGESYGTFRAAGIASTLVKHGVAFNGIVLVSSILNWMTARNYKGNDLPYALFLPTYTATAWFHNRLDPDLQSDLQGALTESKAWALGPYWSALAKGDQLQGQERADVRGKLARLTGLSESYVENRDLRIEIMKFCKELTRDDKRTVGRLDSRFVGIDGDHSNHDVEHDPSMTAIMAPYCSTFNQYIRTELGYKIDRDYQVFGGIKKPWDWGGKTNSPPDTSESLRQAMSKNPHLKVYIASGYYDLATPFFATEFTLAHLGLDPSLRSNITTGEYEAGHMMYISEPSLQKLKADISSFIDSAV